MSLPIGFRYRAKMQTAVANALRRKRPISPELASAFIHLVLRTKKVKEWQERHTPDEDAFRNATEWNSAAPDFARYELYLPPPKFKSRYIVPAAIVSSAVSPLAMRLCGSCTARD